MSKYGVAYESRPRALLPVNDRAPYTDIRDTCVIYACRKGRSALKRQRAVPCSRVDVVMSFSLVFPVDVVIFVVVLVVVVVAVAAAAADAG